MYRDLTYLQFLVLPQLFDNYLTQLQANNDDRTLRDLFILYSMTLLQWVGKDIQTLDSNLPFDAIINNRLKNRRMFGLLVMIGKKTGLGPEYFQGFMGNRQYAAYYFKALMGVGNSSQVEMAVMAEYYADRFFQDDVKLATKEDQLKVYAAELQESIKYKLGRIKICQNLALKKAYAQLLVDLQLALKLKPSLQISLQSISPFLPTPLNTRLIKYLQCPSPNNPIVIQPQLPYQPPQSTPFLSNPYLLRCKPRDRIQFLQLKLCQCFRSLDQKCLADTRQLIQSCLPLTESPDDKSGLYCLLLSLKILSTSNAQTLSEVQTMYTDILELGSPPIRTVKWLVLGLVYASNYFDEEQLKLLSSWIGRILVERKSNDRNFICVALVHALLELKTEKADISDKINWFWRYVTEAKQMLFKAVGNYHILAGVLSIAYHRMSSKIADKVFSNQFVTLKGSDILEPEIQPKFKTLSLQAESNFTEGELLEIIEITRRTLRSLQYDQDQKAQQLQSLEVQRLKILFLSCYQAQNPSPPTQFIEQTLSHLCTFPYPCKNPAERLPQHLDPKPLLKLLCLTLPTSQSFICYQLIEDCLDIEKTYQFLARNEIKDELLRFINHVEILQALLRMSAVARQEDRVKRIVAMLEEDGCYQFCTEVKARKVQVRRVLDFVGWLSSGH